MGYTERLLWFVRQLPALSVTLATYGVLFAGQRAWSKGMSMRAYDGASFDNEYGTEDAAAEEVFYADFLTPYGFLLVIAHVMSMHQGAVFLAAMPCSTWIFMSRWSTGRHLNIMGYAEKDFVHFQNVLVSRVVYVLI